MKFPKLGGPVQQIGKTLLILAAFACMALTIAHSTKGANRIPKPSVGWLAAAVVLFLIHYFIQAVGAHLILRALGQRVPARANIRSWYMSLIARWMPGRVWYFTTRGYLAQKSGVPIGAFTVAIILELTYMLVGGIIATLLFAGALIKGLLVTGAGRTSLIGCTVIAFSAGALALKPSSMVWLCRFKLFRKVVKRLGNRDISDDDVPTMSTVRSVGLLTYYTLFWIYSGIMFGVLARAFTPMESVAKWLACIPAFAGSWLVGYFSIVAPAGLGARETAMWLMLKPVMPQTEAIILTVTSRLMMLFIELLSVGITYVVLRGAVTVPELDINNHPGDKPEESKTDSRDLAGGRVWAEEYGIE